MNKTYSVIVNSAKSTLHLNSGEIVVKSERGTNTIRIQSPTIDHVDWYFLSNYATLQIHTKGKHFYAISELKVSDKDEINEYLADQFQLEEHNMKTFKVQISGHNDGQYEFGEKSFSLSKDDRVLLNLPYSRINQVQAPSLNDLMLGFDTDEDADGESLLSIRFLVPSNNQESAKDLRIQLDQRTNLTAGTERHIAEIKDVDFVKPKKKYKLRFCDDLLFMYNTEVSHKIYYSQISMIQRFERPSSSDNKEEYLLITLNKPIWKGQKSYLSLVILTNTGNPVVGEGISEDKTLSQTIEELMHQVGRINIESSSGNYLNMAHEEGNFCNYKTSSGFLYLTPRSFVFLHSHVIEIPYANVQSVKFEKVNELNRTKKFDLAVTDKTTTYTFTSIHTFSSIQIEELGEGNEDFDKDQTSQEYAFNGLQSFIKYIKNYHLKIEDRKELSESIEDLHGSIFSHERRNKQRAKELLRKQAQEQNKQFDTIDDDEEEDEDYKPNANKDDGNDDGGDDDDEEEETEDEKGKSNSDKSDSD